MTYKDQAWIATRRRWEKKFLDNNDLSSRWDVLQEVLNHVETLYELEELKRDKSKTV